MLYQRAFLCLDGWAGRREVPVLVVCEIQGRTMQRARIEFLESALLPGGRRFERGDRTVVPMYSIRLVEEE